MTASRSRDRDQSLMKGLGSRPKISHSLTLWQLHPFPHSLNQAHSPSFSSLFFSKSNCTNWSQRLSRCTQALISRSLSPPIPIFLSLYTLMAALLWKTNNDWACVPDCLCLEALLLVEAETCGAEQFHAAVIKVLITAIISRANYINSHQNRIHMLCKWWGENCEKHQEPREWKSKRECDLKENRGGEKRSMDLAANGSMALLIPGKGISKSSSEKREKLKENEGGGGCSIVPELKLRLYTSLQQII